MVGVSRVDDADKVRDIVQTDNSLKIQNNMGRARSPLTMNFRAAQRINPTQANDAGVVISISNNHTNNSAQSNISLSNIDMDLFAAD